MWGNRKISFSCRICAPDRPSPSLVTILSCCGFLLRIGINNECAAWAKFKSFERYSKFYTCALKWLKCFMISFVSFTVDVNPCYVTTQLLTTWRHILFFFKIYSYPCGQVTPRLSNPKFRRPTHKIPSLSVMQGKINQEGYL